jgi:cell division septation protein DedD
VNNATALFTPGEPQTARGTPQPPVAPTTAHPVRETGPMDMSHTTPVTTRVTAAPQPAAPAPPAVAMASDSMKGKYVIRLITLRYDARRQALAQKIKAHMESNGFPRCIVRTSNGKLVVEVGPYDKYREADLQKAKVRKMRVGHERFDSAYVVQRSK